MAIQESPPSWFVDLVNPSLKHGVWAQNAFTDFLRQLIPFMDLLQWGHDFVDRLKEVISHQPPVNTRIVYGNASSISAMSSDPSKALIPIGEVGYDSIKRKVLWNVNEYGGWQKSSAEFDVPAMLPILMQLLTMIPWDIIGEFGPTGDDLGVSVYNIARDALKVLGVNIPLISLNGSEYKNTQGNVKIAEGNYTFTHGSMTYTVTADKDYSFEPGQNVMLTAVSTTNGSDLFSVGEKVTINFGIDPLLTVESSVGKKIDKGSTSKPTTVQIIVKNTSYGLQAIPSWDTIATHNIPIMDLSQLVYDGVSLIVDSIYHHPPQFEKYVYTGGVWVEYEYFTVKEDGSNKRQWQRLPTIYEVQGNTLQIDAVFYSDAVSGIKKKEGRRTLITVPFFLQDSDITLFENLTYGYQRGDRTFGAIVYCTIQNLGAEQVIMRAGTYEFITAGETFTGTLATDIVLYPSSGILVQFESVNPVSVSDGSVTITGVDVPTPAGLTSKVNNNSTSGRVGIACENPAESIDLSAGDSIIPSPYFREGLVPAYWEVVSVVQGTNYVDKIPQMPVYNKMGEIVSVPDAVPYVSAQPAELTIHVKTIDTGDVEDEFLFNAASVPLPKKTIELTYTSVNRKKITVPLWSTVITGVTGVNGIVNGIINAGRDAALTPDKQAAGDDQGEPTIISLLLNNASTFDVDMEFIITALQSVTIAGEEFILSTVNPTGTLPAASTSGMTFYAENELLHFTSKPITAIEAHFGSSAFVNPTTTVASWFLRWFEESTLTFVGETFSAGGDITPLSAVPQYLFSRVRVMYEGDGHWVNHYTGDAGSNDYFNDASITDKHVPRGVAAIAIIRYNASERSISVTNLADGSSIKMKVNTCMWFIAQHLMMLPIQII